MMLNQLISSWFLELLVFFKGFHVTENSTDIDTPAIKHSKYILNTDSVLEFDLYKVDYTSFNWRYGVYKKIPNQKYVLKLNIVGEVPEELQKFKKMSLKLYTSVNKNLEDLMFSIIKAKFVNFVIREYCHV